MMLRSRSVLCLARLSVLLPFALSTAACGGEDAVEVGGAGASTDGGAPGNGGASGNAAIAGGAGTSSTSGGAGQGLGGAAGNAEAGNTGAEAGADSGADAAGALGPPAVPLGDAGEYAILAQSAISNVPTSAITGDLGLSPAAASYITGFELTRAGDRWTSPEITGSIFASDNDPGTPAALTTAVADMLTAYTDAATRPTPSFLNLGDGAIGGLTLAPGLYRWTSTVTIPSDVTLSGGAQDVWIFQITGDLTMAADQRVTLSGGALAKNIVWQVAGEVDFGSASHAEGVVLSKTAIHLGTGASIQGRLLAQTAVTLQGSTVTAP
jgi:ice-binding like protein